MSLEGDLARLEEIFRDRAIPPRKQAPPRKKARSHKDHRQLLRSSYCSDACLPGPHLHFYCPVCEERWLFEISKKPHKLALEREIAQHIKRDHAQQIVAPLYLGYHIWTDPFPVYCEECGDAYLPKDSTAVLPGLD